MAPLLPMQWIVTVAGLSSALAALFGLRRSPPRNRRSMPQTFQEAAITTRHGFTPAVIVLARGLEAKLRFRRDDGDSKPLHISAPALNLDRTLPPFTTTTVDVTTDAAGVYQVTSSEGDEAFLVVLTEIN